MADEQISASDEEGISDFEPPGLIWLPDVTPPSSSPQKVREIDFHPGILMFQEYQSEIHGVRSPMSLRPSLFKESNSQDESSAEIVFNTQSSRTGANSFLNPMNDLPKRCPGRLPRQFHRSPPASCSSGPDQAISIRQVTTYKLPVQFTKEFKSPDAPPAPSRKAKIRQLPVQFTKEFKSPGAPPVPLPPSTKAKIRLPEQFSRPVPVPVDTIHLGGKSVALQLSKDKEVAGQLIDLTTPSKVAGYEAVSH